jgi:ketosteroid isomerase-like protein
MDLLLGVRTMNNNQALKLVLTGVFLLSLTSAYAQESADDSANVWSVIEEEWNADEKGDKKWPDRLLTDDFSGWGKDSPAPRSKSSTKMWDRFSDELGEMLAHELYPLSIVVHGDVAVAHYLYSSAFQSKDGDIEMSNGRYTDVLVRSDDGWMFLTWHGGDDD